MWAEVSAKVKAQELVWKLAAAMVSTLVRAWAKE
jgi:hypothetical protein